MAGSPVGLTAKQRALARVVCQEWVEHGLTLQPADRATAQAGVGLVYRAAGLPPPRRVVWAGSPVAGVVAALALTAGSDPDVRVAPEAWDRVWARLAAEAGMPAGEPVWAHLGHDQVGAPVWSRIREPVWDAWWAAWAQVGEPAWEEAATWAAWVDAQVGVVGEAIWQQISGQSAEAGIGWQVGREVHRHVREPDETWEWEWGSEIWPQLLAKVTRRAWLPPWELVVAPPRTSSDGSGVPWPEQIEDDPDDARPPYVAKELRDLSAEDDYMSAEDEYLDDEYRASLERDPLRRRRDRAGTPAGSMMLVRWRSSTSCTGPWACAPASRWPGSC